MAKYRPILCGFWDDPDIEAFTPEEKLVYLFLFSNRATTESGIYSISDKFISERTGVSNSKINTILNTLKNKYKKITRDGNVIFIHGFLNRNYKGRPEFLEKSILQDMQNHPSLLIWSKFCEIYKFHCISKKIKELLNTCSLDNADVADINSNSNRTDNSIDLKEGMQGEKEKPQRNIIPPLLEWVQQYCKERGSSIDPEYFFDSYIKNGWMVGKNKMKDWQATIRTWEKNGYSNSGTGSGQGRTSKSNIGRPGYDSTGNAIGAQAKPGEFDEGIITLEGVPDHR